MNKERILSLLLVVVLLLSIFGCSAKSDYVSDVMVEELAAAPESVMSPAYDEKETASSKMAYADVATENEDFVEEAVSTDVGGGEPAPPEEVRERKLVYTTNMSLQTREFENSVKLLEETVKQSNGYIEYSNVENGDISITSPEAYHSSRTANYTIKIPGASSETFMSFLQSNYHVVSTNNSTQDITAGYYDSQTMLKSQVEHEERLKELLDKGGSLEYLLEIEREIANVRYNINSINSQIKNMEMLSDFNTVNITLIEVIKYEETPQIDDSFSTRVSRALSSSWISFVNGMQNVVIDLIFMLPTIVIVAIIATIAIIIIRKVRKKNKKTDKNIEAILPYQETTPAQPAITQAPTENTQEQPKNTKK